MIRIAAVTLVACGSAWAQSLPDPHRIDEGYDGRFRFVRLRWDSGMAFGRRGMSNAWNHDFPRAEQNLARILEFVTLVDVNPEGRILRLSDPELFNHPIVYMWEPGFWVMTDNEAQRFREYLLKGGFAIFDDFEYDQWNNLEAQMRRVLPEARWVELDASHRVFDSFFRMTDIDFPHPMYGIKPTYYGIFENNDPGARLMAIANHNHDVAEYWEFSATGLFPIDLSNEAYKLGVNYMIYGLTH
ncbi:MAG TPA: DUF4159 domain-containing protein [Vicinamibacterales bacterium]|nr:DUF4159 domain-containing protein [Vicinamibacterales bacterium]